MCVYKNPFCCFITTFLKESTFISFCPLKFDFNYHHFGFILSIVNYETSNSRVYIYTGWSHCKMYSRIQFCLASLFSWVEVFDGVYRGGEAAGERAIEIFERLFTKIVNSNVCGC